MQAATCTELWSYWLYAAIEVSFWRLHNIIFSHSLSLFAAEQASKWNPTNNTRGRGGSKRYFHHNTVLTSQYNTTSSKVRTKGHYFRLWAKRMKHFKNIWLFQQILKFHQGWLENWIWGSYEKMLFFNIHLPYVFFSYLAFKQSLNSEAIWEKMPI